MLLRNNTRKNSKGGKLCFNWIGSCIVLDITKLGRASLQNKNAYCLNPYQAYITFIQKPVYHCNIGLVSSFMSEVSMIRKPLH